MVSAIILAAALSVQKNGVDFTVDVEPQTIDPGRSVFVTLTAKSAPETDVVLPDLGPRARGFSAAEAFTEEPVKGKDGQLTRTVNWKLVPEPCAETYKIAPFVVAVTRGGQDASFVAGPVYFDQPEARKAVTGGIELSDLKPDKPPFSWRRLGIWSLWALAALPVLVGVYFLVKYLMRRVREHLMSPIERAWVELDRLIAKGLPGRGQFKDFYVELTMVVRRYIQRKYGIRAPHLTTEEFFEKMPGAWCLVPGAEGDSTKHEAPRTKHSELSTSLKTFLESADMVKFAGVEVTPAMADEATDSARAYLKSDSAE